MVQKACFRSPEALTGTRIFPAASQFHTARIAPRPRGKAAAKRASGCRPLEAFDLNDLTTPDAKPSLMPGEGWRACCFGKCAARSRWLFCFSGRGIRPLLPNQRAPVQLAEYFSSSHDDQAFAQQRYRLFPPTMVLAGILQRQMSLHRLLSLGRSSQTHKAGSLKRASSRLYEQAPIAAYPGL